MTSGVATEQNIDGQVWRKENKVNLLGPKWRLILLSAFLLDRGRFYNKGWIVKGVGPVCFHLFSTDLIISTWFEWNSTDKFLLLSLLFTCPVPKWTNTPLNIVINLSRGGPDTRLIRVAVCVVGAAHVSFCRVRKRGSWSANQVCRCYAKALGILYHV